MMKAWVKRISSASPSCKKVVEDNDHILSCQADEAIAKYGESVVTLKEWLDASNIFPDLSSMLINKVVNWKRKNPIMLHEGELFDSIHTLFKAYESI